MIWSISSGLFFTRNFSERAATPVLMCSDHSRAWTAAPGEVEETEASRRLQEARTLFERLGAKLDLARLEHET